MTTHVQIDQYRVCHGCYIWQFVIFAVQIVSCSWHAGCTLFSLFASRLSENEPLCNFGIYV